MIDLRQPGIGDYLPGFSIPHINQKDTVVLRDLTKLNLLKLQNSAEALALSFIEQASVTSNQNFRDKFLDMIAHDEGFTLSLPEMCDYLSISKSHLERLVRDYESLLSAAEHRLYHACDQ